MNLYNPKCLKLSRIQNFGDDDGPRGILQRACYSEDAELRIARNSSQDEGAPRSGRANHLTLRYGTVTSRDGEKTEAN